VIILGVVAAGALLGVVVVELSHYLVPHQPTFALVYPVPRTVL
jgi:hypothetical protein